MQDDDIEGKGYVHYLSWIETYTGLMDPLILESRSLEKCVKLARNFPENTWVALDGNKVVGFACYMKSADTDLQDTGEVRALYVLKSHQKKGIGKKLMDLSIASLHAYRDISIWVLDTNKNAIGFYTHFGFEKDGMEKDVEMGAHGVIHEIRMIWKR